MNKEKVTAILAALLLAAGLAAAGYGGYTLLKDEAELSEYDKVAEIAGAPGNDAATNAGGEGGDGEAQEDGGIDWDALKEINGDACGWVSVDGTAISYPVAKAPEDDPEHYLRYTFSGNYSVWGCPYLDAGCDPNGRALVLYGHHASLSDKMFSDLGDAYSREKFEQLGGAWWTTPELGGKRFRLVGSVCCDRDEGATWVKTSFPSAAEAQEWLKGVLPLLDQRSGEAGELSSTATRVLIMVTCSEAGGHTRCVTVFADPDPDFA